jgi:hypothetical protein
MAERRRIGMLLLHHGTPRDRRAHAELAAALGEGEVSEPDEIGVFEVTVEATDQEQALRKVWDAVAAAGADDHVVFLEHPDLPEHWRRVSGRPGAA